MGKARWVGIDLWNLLNLPMSQLVIKYPQHTKGTLKGKRQYWKQKLKEGKIVMPESEPKTEIIDNAPVGAEGWWQVVTANPDNPENPVITTAYRGRTSQEDLAEVFEPAKPARITPTRRKRATELGKRILVFGDSQIGYHRVYDREGQDSLVPIHSEEALSVIAQLNAELRPHTIVNLSDTVDLGELGRFRPQSDGFHRTLGPSFQRAHNLYAQLRADNPDARIVEPDSNHTARVQKRMMERYPEWYGFTLPGEDYPMMSYYRLANLAHVGVEFISGYGGAKFVYGEEYDKPPIVFNHGTHSSSNPGATVKKESLEYPNAHRVRGHGHSFEHIARTDRSTGDTTHYIQLGTTCSTTGNTPSYHSAMDDFGHPVRNQENWQNQAMVITDYEGSYQFDVINIVRGLAIYKDRLYNGAKDE